MDNELIECSHGPVSSMPGSRTLVAEGVARCLDHSDRWAQYRVQGETDSMGCEYIHLCAECAEAERLRALIPVDGYCEWHKGEGSDLRPMRDYDEGMAGPLYMTCAKCRTRVNEAARRELEESRGYDDYDPIETCEGDWDPVAEDEPRIEDFMIPDAEERAAALFGDELPDTVTPATRLALEKERGL